MIIWQQIVHWITSSIHENSKLKPGENMLCTEIDSDIQNNFCTQHILPMFCKKKSSDKDLPVFTYSPLFRWVFKLLNMYFFMALKVVLQVCNGFCNNQRKGTTIDVFSSYMWSKPKSFKWCIWTIKSISSYIWIILVRHLNGQNWFLKVHSLWKKTLNRMPQSKSVGYSSSQSAPTFLVYQVNLIIF